ncbi:MAG: response regulator [Ignavibacteria bacterium]|jgi:signal transduction histidine kinase|nr:response regulator [Ignavibacteria bacterium]
MNLNSNVDISKHILAIENNPQLQRLLVATFKKHKIDVTNVDNFIDAENVLNDDNNNIDIMIIDVSNNIDIEAFEFCASIRQKFAQLQLPILILSDVYNATVIASAYDAGCNELLAVPYNNVEFINKVNFLIDTKKVYDQKMKLISVMDIRTQVFKMNTHDLKNPLSSIFSLSGIPVESFSGNEEISQTFNVIHNASKIMMSLVNENLEFLSLSSLDVKLEQSLIDIVSVINQIYEINNPLAKDKQQQLITNFTDEDCFIISDSRKIYQAINNIVSNAIKFSPLGKRIWLDVVKEDDMIKIIIKDEGPGFKKEEMDVVFTKFGKHSATPTGDEVSTGLGMLITKQIVNLANGDIFLESEEGKGAKFTIMFQSVSPDAIK